MGGILDSVRALGADIVVVGNGSAKQAAAFHAAQHMRMPLYTDPSLKTYAALDLVRGFGKTLGFAAFAHGARAFRAGFRQGKTEGDPWQQGGVFVVLPDGTMPYAYRSKEAGDHPDPELVLAALKAAVATPVAP